MAIKKEFSNFQEILDTVEGPLLVDFYAPWCGPCQLMAPILEKVSKQMQQRLKIVKINTDTYPQLASQYQVHALPTFVLFKQGQVVNRIEGALPADQLLRWLEPQV
ncbi:thioredoxin [Trichothermofontia sichuanensis B231]|uniref:thioredoxin n=1 Tax=Trichothermofontia sichuanensis TaxID=3045816 RepID=UPI002247D4BD|nr:thioredoxin [Trichothermofontia sichuanensis]UZQ54942.1 thioredoxin [Trichothermofontia sichuanensis B231]